MKGEGNDDSLGGIENVSCGWHGSWGCSVGSGFGFGSGGVRGVSCRCKGR